MRQVPTWATTTSYPAGTASWAGLSTAVDPGTDIFVPEDDLAAEHANFAIKGAALDGVHAAQHQAMGRSWPRKVFAKTTKDVCPAPGGYAWLSVVDDAGTYNILEIPNAADADSLATWRANIGGNTPHKMWQFKDGVVVFGQGGTLKRITTGGGITTPGAVAGSTWDAVGSWTGPGSSNGFALGHSAASLKCFHTQDDGATWTSTAAPAALSTVDTGFNRAAYSGTCVMFAPKIAALKYDVLRVTGTAGGYGTISSVQPNAAGHVYDIVYDRINSKFIAFSDDQSAGTDTAITISVDDGATFSAVVTTIPGFVVRSASCENGVITVLGTPRYQYLSDTSTIKLAILYAFVEDLTKWYRASANPSDTSVPVILDANDQEVIAFCDTQIWVSGHTGQLLWTGLSVP